VHIAAVVVAFGVTFAYPLFVLAGARLDPSAMPWFHRMQQLIGRRLINPGLGVVLLAGIYLASYLDKWHAFYVQWGIGVVIVLGALEGAFMTRVKESSLTSPSETSPPQAPERRNGVPNTRRCASASGRSAPSRACWC
jgi:hypothetical protein